MTSIQPRKQRKERIKAPLHRRQRFMRAALGDALRKKYSKRTARVAEGDVAKVMRGDHRGIKGKVQTVDLTHERVTIDGITVKKADGSEVARPIRPSNIQIIKLNLKDKRREEIIER